MNAYDKHAGHGENTYDGHAGHCENTYDSQYVDNNYDRHVVDKVNIHDRHTPWTGKVGTTDSRDRKNTHDRHTEEEAIKSTYTHSGDGAVITTGISGTGQYLRQACRGQGSTYDRHAGYLRQAFRGRGST